MTNPKENRLSLVLGGQESRSVELARRPGDLNSSWRSGTITDGEQSDDTCWWLIIYKVAAVWVRVCVFGVPLCLVCAGFPESVIGPWGWTRPAPECPACDAGGRDQKNCPWGFAEPPWPAAAPPPVASTSITLRILFSAQVFKFKFFFSLHSHVRVWCNAVMQRYDWSWINCLMKASFSLIIRNHA